MDTNNENENENIDPNKEENFKPYEENSAANAGTPPELSVWGQRVKGHKRIVRWMWRLYILGMASVITLFIGLSYQLPSFEQLENPKSRIASTVLSSDGIELGKYYVENRTPVEFDSISPHLVNALISTEDARFKDHAGIDPWALGRVFVKTFLLQQRNAGGGSTISQQLAKLLVGRPDTKDANSITRLWLIGSTKLKEWLTAVKLERAYTKNEIISMYFNEFDFLYGAHGIKSASEIYFKKHPYDLSINEAAMLIRMLKNPSLYNPRRDMARALKGREQVLKNMQIAGHMSESEYHMYRKEPIDLSRFEMKNHNDGIATHFREYLREHLKDLLKQDELLKADGTSWDIYRDGLKIYTTIDSRIQKHAEKAVKDHLSEHQKKLFEHWPGWKTGEGKDPWTYRARKVTRAEIAMRLQAFERTLWTSDRYRLARSKYLKTAIALELRDSEIYRMITLEGQDDIAKKGKKRKDREFDSQALMDFWVSQKFIKESDPKRFRDIMSSSDWSKIKEEYKAIMDYMKEPVEMKIFAYNSRGETDTIMSPYDSIKYHRMHLQTGSLSIEPQTGHIRSWVGGINHKYFKYDHANKHNARQVGSTMKPFLYALTIDIRGYSPCYQILDTETTIEKGYGKFNLIRDWTPRNAGGGYSNSFMTLTQALRKSLNSVSASLMKDLNSTEPLRAFLNDIGVDTTKVPNSPTICLGTADLSVFEMTGGYCIFANEGIYTEPIFIDRIEDCNGNLIYSAEASQIQEQVLSEEGAFAMNKMLQTVQSGAGGFRGIKSKYGGKTGTTNYQADGWFMGITPHIVMGTWVGCDDRFIRFRSLGYGQGARMARPIFQNFIRNIEGDTSLNIDVTQDFPEPDLNVIDRRIEMDCLKYAQFSDKGDEFEKADYTDDDSYNLWDYDDEGSTPTPKKDSSKIKPGLDDG